MVVTGHSDQWSAGSKKNLAAAWDTTRSGIRTQEHDSVRLKELEAPRGLICRWGAKVPGDTIK